MSFIEQSVRNGSDNIHLSSEEQIVISSVTSYSSNFVVVHDTSEQAVSIADEIVMILDNLVNREPEPEDILLADSGILQHLVEQARRNVPSPNWEHELDEL